MFNKKLSIPLATLVFLIGSGAYLFFSRKDETTAKTVLISKDAVPEISCYPTNKYKPPIEIKKFTYQGKTYYETNSPQRNSPGAFVLDFEVSSSNCRQIGNIMFTSREDFMPKPAADYFAEQYVESLFKSCLEKKENEPNAKQKCKEYIEKKVNVPGTLNAEHTSFLFLEDAEALNRRGIKTDKALIIRPKRSRETGLPAKIDLPSDPQTNSKTKLTKNEIFQYQLSRLKTCNSDLPELKITNFHFIGFVHENAFLMKSYRKSSELEHKNFGFQIALKINGSNNDEYYIQRVLYFHNANCVHAYTGKRGDSTALHSIFDQQDARSLALTWYKWRLAKISGERNSTQGYLNSNYPALAEEEYWALSQLGYKMPKNYKLIP